MSYLIHTPCRRLRIEVNDINRLNRFRNEPIYFFVYIILYWIKFFDIDNGRYKRKSLSFGRTAEYQFRYFADYSILRISAEEAILMKINITENIKISMRGYTIINVNAYWEENGRRYAVKACDGLKIDSNDKEVI